MTALNEAIFPSEEQLNRELIFPSEDQLSLLTDKPKPPSITLSSIIREQFKEHPLTTIWSLILFTGGIIFIAYYFNIRYMPELDLSASASLLATVSLTGLFVIFIFAVYAVCSGAVWGEAIKENRDLKSLLLEGHLVSTKRILLLIVIPAVLFTVIFNLLFWGSEHQSFNVLALFAGFILSFLLLLNHRRYIKNKGRHARSLALIYVLFTFISWMFLLIQLFLIIIIAKPRLTPLLPAFPYLLGLQIVVVFLNSMALVVPRTFKSSFVWYLMTGVIIIFVTLLGLNSLMLVPTGVIRQFGFGDITNASIVVNKEGREMLLGREILSGCAKDEKLSCLEGSEGSNMFMAKNVDILSRLGNNFYLRCKNKDGKAVEFTLPSSMIISWGRPPQ